MTSGDYDPPFYIRVRDQALTAGIARDFNALNFTTFTRFALDFYNLQSAVPAVPFVIQALKNGTPVGNVHYWNGLETSFAGVTTQNAGNAQAQFTINTILAAAASAGRLHIDIARSNSSLYFFDFSAQFVTAAGAIPSHIRLQGRVEADLDGFEVRTNNINTFTADRMILIGELAP